MFGLNKLMKLPRSRYKMWLTKYSANGWQNIISSLYVAWLLDGFDTIGLFVLLCLHL